MFTSLLVAAAVTTAPASQVRVPVVDRPARHSVQYFDNIINVTNRVLDRTIYQDIRRVHTDKLSGELHEMREEQNRVAVEAHCKVRLRVSGLNGEECAGTNRR